MIKFLLKFVLNNFVFIFSSSLVLHNFLKEIRLKQVMVFRLLMHVNIMRSIFPQFFCCAKIEYDAETGVLCFQGNMLFVENGVAVFSTDKLEYPCEASISVGDDDSFVLG